MYFSGGTKAQEVRSGIWLVGYLIAMGLISYLGSATFGGVNELPAPWDTVVIFCYWGVSSGLETAAMREASANITGSAPSA